MSTEALTETLVIEGVEVRITHPEKLYFTKQAKLSKIDIVRYYLSVAPGALRGIVDRPIVLKRFVNGAEGEAFYQKRAPAERPEWLRTVTLSFPSGRTAEEVVVDNAAGLAWIANLGCIELHPHPVRSAEDRWARLRSIPRRFGARQKNRAAILADAACPGQPVHEFSGQQEFPARAIEHIEEAVAIGLNQ